MTWVKVCGLRQPGDVEAAVNAGADAVGFVLSEGSPRQVSVERATALMEGIPVLRVLVTAHATPEELGAAVEATGADAIQPHGRHAELAAAAGEAVGLFVLRPVAMGGGGPGPDPRTLPERQIPLLDSVKGDGLGGTGTVFDWSTVPLMDRRFVIAGGLKPGNVADAIGAAHPWGVDASSGLESSPGIKDAGRVVAFIEEAKRA